MQSISWNIDLFLLFYLHILLLSHHILPNYFVMQQRNHLTSSFQTDFFMYVFPFNFLMSLNILAVNVPELKCYCFWFCFVLWSQWLTHQSTSFSAAFQHFAAWQRNNSISCFHIGFTDQFEFFLADIFWQFGRWFIWL